MAAAEGVEELRGVSGGKKKLRVAGDPSPDVNAEREKLVNNPEPGTLPIVGWWEEIRVRHSAQCRDSLMEDRFGVCCFGETPTGDCETPTRLR